MTDFTAVGTQFLQHFYNTFDTDRKGLAQLYDAANSMLTFESEQFMGVEAILQKLSSFNQVKHKINTFDVQPSVSNCIICFVTGELYIDDSQNPLMFSQTFYLVPGGSAGYYVHNDMFRLNMAWAWFIIAA